MTENKRYRVVQWATGNVGSRSLRAVIEHPLYDLVGVYVTSAAKAGKDAGELCGLGPVTGVKATDKVEAIMALDADAVLYMPAFTDYDQVCRLLASGKNIVTPRGEFLHPAAMNPERRAEVQAACIEGGTSIHSSGSSPGFISDALPLPLLAQQRRLDCLTINEYANMESRNSPEMIFQQMGYGVSPGQFNQHMLAHVKQDFSGSLIGLAEAMNLTLDDITVEGDTAVANKDVEIAAGKIEAGTVAGLRITVTGVKDGKPLLRFRAHWYCTTDLDQDWGEMLYSGWNVKVEGDAPMELRLTFPVKLEDYAAFTPGLTAHRPVNAIPAVVAAAPGIRTNFELPNIAPLF
ncbi:dihydrodipicolinate reductase [Sphingobium sufflavum]|uniref:NAD(P)H-dependent amine dehydrogenase family protein n=1 Tax=Sphingobium sufflavum TaxID=1129547 RepID=UPI001F3048BE|nr:dihydrodipicolinate reductase [Sphingobium sufflavum]MCE7796799.1 dihydrodipicolinate reductase [Sphingobium sufflavum]